MLIINQLKEYRQNKQWQLSNQLIINQLTPIELIYQKSDNCFVLYTLLDEVFMSLFYNKRYHDCLIVMDQFKYSYVDKHIITNTDYILSHLLKITKKNKIVITYDINRKPSENELVICYGDFPYAADNLINCNPVYRHSKFYHNSIIDKWESAKSNMIQIEFGYNLVWDQVDQLIVINLDERLDRWVAILRECIRAKIPLNKVYRLSATKSRNTSDPILNGHIGCATSNLEAITYGLQLLDRKEDRKGNIVVWEDDFCFSSRLEQHLNDLAEFFRRQYDYHVCLWATSKHFKLVEHDDIVNHSYQECTTTAGYMLSYEGLKRVEEIWTYALDKLIETGDHIKYSCDRSWSILQKEDKFFSFKLKFGYQQPSYSSIQNQTNFNLD